MVLAQGSQEVVGTAGDRTKVPGGPENQKSNGLSKDLRINMC